MATGTTGTTGTRGLIIGKFMPVHAGHRYLIEAAREQVGHLTVAVCTRPDEPIPGALRYRWMRALYPDLDVLHSATTLPSYPHEHPDFWNLWTRTLKRLHPAPIDYVFGSDDYIPQFAAHLGARPVVLDPARAMVPISATAIRSDPFAHWDYIPDVVRPYFVRTVCLVGAESTGKTTLAERLARSIGTVWAPEYARGYLEGRADPLGTLTLDDMEAVARGHLAQAERLRAQASKVLILDTDLTTTAIYSRHYLGACPAWIEDAAERERHDLYLLCAPDTPWVADAQRDLPRLRAELHARFEESLRQRRLPYVELRGAWDERFARAADAVAALLSPSAPTPAGPARL